MIGKIHSYIDRAFEETPNSKKVNELKEELLSNLIEKYNDQLKSGKSEAEAYTAAIAGIGDINELIESVRDDTPLIQTANTDKKRTAICITTAVILYIMSVFTLILFTEIFDERTIGVLSMFLLISIATGLIVYSTLMKSQYIKADETLVEDFKEWRGKLHRNNASYRSFKSAYWLIVVAIYLSVNFLFQIWAFSWIIFILANAVINIIDGLLAMRRENDEK